MTHADYFMLALCLWREARGEGRRGQVAVACVIRNRVVKRQSSFYEEVIKRWQFSSITAKGDPQLGLYPQSYDADWVQCKVIAQDIVDGKLQDETLGATLYYADSMAFPGSWDIAKVKETIKIGHHTFYVEC